MNTADNHTPPPIPSRSQSWERNVLEKLAMATVREQRAARRWRTFTRLAWLAFFACVVWLFVSQAGSETAKLSSPHTAVIDVHGLIEEDGEVSAASVLPAVKAAFEDAGAIAVVLHINSGGGSPVQSGIINDELQRMKKQYNKPLYAVVGDTCASGAYYIAVAADEIFVDKASLVGSIGVRMDGFGFTGAMEKLGIERSLLTAGANKGFLDPFSPMNEVQQQKAQHMLNQIHKQFIDVVRAGRGQRLKETEDTFSGLVWTGEEAVRMGLADRLGNVSFVAREVVKQENIVDYTKRDNVAEKLVKKFGAAAGESAARVLGQMPATLR